MRSFGIGLLLTLAFLFPASRAVAGVVDIPESRRLGPVSQLWGEGFCGQFTHLDQTQASPWDALDDTTEGTALLNDPAGLAASPLTDADLYGIVPVGDWYDGNDNSFRTTGELAFNNLFPWSQNTTSNQNCTLHSLVAPNDNSENFAMRLRGNLIIPAAGVWTVGIRSPTLWRRATMI